MKVALVYDHVNRIGGAERILKSICELYPQAPLFTSVYDPIQAGWAKKFNVKSSFMQFLPFAKTYHELYPVWPIFAFESFDFRKFDVVISITSAEAKSIITSPSTLHICYCLTPTRYLWSHYSQYFDHSWFRRISLPAVSLLRIQDLIASARPDVYIAISQAVAKRIKKYYRQFSQVLYPPVDTKTFKPYKPDTKGKYFLIVSRLVKYKYTDLAIKAFNQLNIPLKIVGQGPASSQLKKNAGSNIEFLGYLTDKQLCKYYQSCQALIFPQEEDFGISALEAMACGKPVIAYRAGGAKEYINPGLTGEYFFPQDSLTLVKTIERFMNKKYSWKQCRFQAKRFSQAVFKSNFQKHIAQEWKKFQLHQAKQDLASST